MNDRMLVNPMEAHVTVLESDVARLRAALQPFANHAQHWLDIGAGLDEPLVAGWNGGPEELPLTVGHLVAARIVLDTSLP